MAYILGFTFADGNIHYCALAWDLKDDVELLKKISKAMKSSYPIKKRKNSFRLRISNPTILQDIQKLGITPNKTKTCQFPNVPEAFLRDFIRGFLDGDGWIYTRKERREISVGFSNGSLKFLEGLSKSLNKHLILTTKNLRTRKKITKNHRISTCYSLEYYCHNAYKIIQYLYDNLKKSDLYLDRKYERQIKARKIFKSVLKGPKGIVKYREIEREYNMPMQKILQKLIKKYKAIEIAEKFDIYPRTIYAWFKKAKVRLPKRKSKKIIVKECPICYRRFKQYRGCSKKYCSEHCRILARQTGKFVECAVCGKEIYRPRWWFKINSIPICSRECMGKWRYMRVKKNLIHRSKKTGRFIFSKSK
ncbi:hypothetical protein J7K42_00180 [bacterium]|nr:hypothetical protein [bacterium]